MCPVFALTLPCLKNGNGQREFDHAARSQAIRNISVSPRLLFPPLSPIIERQTVCKLQTQKQKARNDMQRSPPTSKNTLSRPLRKYWTPYAELQRRKADGRQGLQGQRRASGACGMG